MLRNRSSKPAPGAYINRAVYRANGQEEGDRYVSLETMQKSNKRCSINDVDESISFDSPQSKATTNTSASPSRNSPTLLLDITTPTAASGPNTSGYDYITVDYFQQAGSEPGSPESAIPSASTSANMPGLNASINTTDSVFEASCPNVTTKPQNNYENLFLAGVQNNCVNTPQLPAQNNASNQIGTTSEVLIHNSNCDDSNVTSPIVTPGSPTSLTPMMSLPPLTPSVSSSQPGLAVEATPENGYGRGAIPKRPQESYYKVWEDKS